jgi:hypothetical protein
MGVHRAQADWIFIFAPQRPTKELRHLPRKMPPQAYQTSQYVGPTGGIISSSGAALLQEVQAVKLMLNQPAL